jgi:hypothetical protein
MVRAKYTAPTRHVEATTMTLVLRPSKVFIRTTKAVSFSLTFGNVQPITTDKTDNGDSVLSEIKPFDRDQLVEYGQRCSDLQEMIICVFYSMGIAGPVLALAGALRFVGQCMRIQ